MSLIIFGTYFKVDFYISHPRVAIGLFSGGTTNYPAHDVFSLFTISHLGCSIIFINKDTYTFTTFMSAQMHILIWIFQIFRPCLLVIHNRRRPRHDFPEKSNCSINHNAHNMMRSLMGSSWKWRWSRYPFVWFSKINNV